MVGINLWYIWRQIITWYDMIYAPRSSRSLAIKKFADDCIHNWNGRHDVDFLPSVFSEFGTYDVITSRCMKPLFSSSANLHSFCAVEAHIFLRVEELCFQFSMWKFIACTFCLARLTRKEIAVGILYKRNVREKALRLRHSTMCKPYCPAEKKNPSAASLSHKPSSRDAFLEDPGVVAHPQHGQDLLVLLAVNVVPLEAWTRLVLAVRPGWFVVVWKSCFRRKRVWWMWDLIVNIDSWHSLPDGVSEVRFDYGEGPRRTAGALGKREWRLRSQLWWKFCRGVAGYERSEGGGKVTIEPKLRDTM